MSEKHINEHYKETIKDEEKKVDPQKSWQFLEEKNKNRLNNIAISEGNTKVTYGELFDGWKSTARTLSGYDMTKENNSRILAIMPNLIKMNLIDYGADITGAIASFPDPTIDYRKLKKYIVDEKITDIVALDFLYAQNLRGKTEELVKEYGIKNIFVVHDKYFTSLMPKKFQFLSKAINIGSKYDKYVERYDDALRNTKNTQIIYDKTSGEDIKREISLITHTSGTTSGIGKPIPITDHNRNALVKQYELAKFNYQPGMTLLHFIPYFAGYGAVNTVHLGLSQGLELQEIPLFSPDKFGDYLIKCQPNIVLANTPCWMNLIKNPKYSDIDLSHFVYASIGGSPLSIEEENKINDFFTSHGADISITKGYGLSETCGCSIVTIDGYNKTGSLGVIMPGVNAKLRTQDGQIHDIDFGGIKGELLLNSETLTCGKLDDKEVVKKIKIDDKEYIETKDIISFDEFGNATYHGRIDGMFQRYDCYNVYPLQIENLFKSYNFIEEAAIVGQYSEKRNGFVPKVILQLSEKAIGVDKDDIIKSIIDNSFLSHNHQFEYEASFRDLPHVWDFVDEMPTNTMGKIDLNALKQDSYIRERYQLNVVESNMSIEKYSIEKNIDLVKEKAR